MICHRTAFESGEEPILHPEQKNQQLPVLAMFRKWYVAKVVIAELLYRDTARVNDGYYRGRLLIRYKYVFKNWSLNGHSGVKYMLELSI
jgi:hypothetical protein